MKRSYYVMLSLLACGVSSPGCGTPVTRTVTAPQAETGRLALGVSARGKTSSEWVQLFIGSAAHSGNSNTGDSYFYINSRETLVVCRPVDGSPSCEPVTIEGHRFDLRGIFPNDSLVRSAGNWDGDPEPSPKQFWVWGQRKGLLRATYYVGSCRFDAEPTCHFSPMLVDDDIFDYAIASHDLGPERSSAWFVVRRDFAIGSDGYDELIRCESSRFEPAPSCKVARVSNEEHASLR